MSTHDRYRPGCGIEGKCSVPMFMGGGPSGYCNEPAFGEQYDPGTKHAPPHWSPRDRYGNWVDPYRLPPFATHFCCKRHGGPGADDIRFVMDGNMWCAFLPDFENLQESNSGFGRTQPEAERDLRSTIASATGAAQ